MSSLVSRAYQYLGPYSYGQRYDMRLPLSVYLLYLKTPTISVPCSPPMKGYLRDLSKTGLSLAVPSLRFGRHFLIDGQYPLGITVELPNRAVNIQIAPVRYDKLHESQHDRRYLIGARITHMTDSDRKLLTDHIQQWREGKTGPFNSGLGDQPV